MKKRFVNTYPRIIYRIILGLGIMVFPYVLNGQIEITSYVIDNGGEMTLENDSKITACQGNNITIKATIQGDISPLRWQYSEVITPVGFSDIPTTGEPFSGVTGNNLTIIDAGLANLKRFFRLKGRANGVDVFSNIVEVIISNNATSLQINASKENICAGETITLTAGGVVSGNGVEIQWFINILDLQTPHKTGQSIQETPNTTTTYYIRKVDNCGTSALSPGKIINVKTIPTAFANIDFSKDSPCEGETVSLNASGGSGEGASIVWYTSPDGTGTKLGTGNPLSITATNSMTIYVRRESGCPNGISADYFEKLTVTPGPTAAFDKFPEVLCKGVEGTFSAISSSGSPTYSWTFFGGNPSSAVGPGPIQVSYSSTGTKTVQLRVIEGGCDILTSGAVMVIDQPSININEISIIQKDEFQIPENIPFEIDFSSNVADVNFEWTCELKSGKLNGLPFSGSGSSLKGNWSLDQSEMDATIECNVTATTAQDCANSDVFSIEVRKLLFIPDVLTPNGDEFNDTWNIQLFETEGLNAEQFEIKLYDRLGHCVIGCDQRFTIADAVNFRAEDCPPGPTWYIITGPNGFEKTGSLTIIKN